MVARINKIYGLCCLYVIIENRASSTIIIESVLFTHFWYKMKKKKVNSMKKKTKRRKNIIYTLAPRFRLQGIKEHRVIYLFIFFDSPVYAFFVVVK